MYKEQIKALRSKGMNRRKIASKLGCSTSTVAYHLSSQVRKSSHRRTRMGCNKEPLLKKRDNFLKCRDPLGRKRTDFNKQYRRNGHSEAVTFTLNQLINKIGQNQKCYLTGRPINLADTKSYNLDHIIPVAKGGDNSLENCGLLCRAANMAKSDMSVVEFLDFCKEVLQHNL